MSTIKRSRIVLGFVLLFFGFLVCRLYAIQIVRHDHYASLKKIQGLAHEQIEIARGTVVDINGTILAVSRPVSSVYSLPSLIEDKEAMARRMAPILDLPAAAILDKLTRTYRDASGMERPVKFVWLKRKVSEDTARAVRRLAHPEIGLKQEYRRLYPAGREGAHLLGYVGIDENGSEGIERMIEQFVHQIRVRTSFDVDGRRRPILDEEDVLMDLSSENTVVLTMNSFIQHSVEQALDQLMIDHPYTSASVVVVNPATGAILAMANRPTYDPNRPGEYSGSERRNRAVTDPYEPGSTMKPFIAAAALESKSCTLDQMFDCEHGSFRIGRRTVRDHHPYGRLSFVDVVVYSSNIGIVKVGRDMDNAIEHRMLQQFGFGALTRSGIPGENPGMLVPLRRWSSFTEVSVPMGYEISVTPLQLAMAMSAIANDGVLMKPYTVDRVLNYEGKATMIRQPTPVRRVISPEIAKQLKDILTQVVQRGTGTRAKIDGVEVGGKTGTSKKIEPGTGTYSTDKYISSFVSFAPVKNPKVCVVVVVDEPRGAYYGGQVAAPVAGGIIRDALAILQ